MNKHISHYTPNVRVENPNIRKVIGTILAVASALTVAAIAGDAASPEIDISFITLPVAAIVGSLTASWQVFFTNPNIPSE